MTIREALTKGMIILKNNNIETPKLKARLLLQYILKKPRQYLIVYDNKEIDAVVELSNGEWCAFEIKLGANQIDDAAKSLLDINKKIEKDPKGKPAKILCVICGLSNAAYKRPDGVYVVPITALKN